MQETKTNEYTEQAEKFLSETGTTFKVKYIKNDYYFDGDKEPRDIYRVYLRRNGKAYNFKFGQSIQSTKNAEEPNAYDVLTCLTKNEPGTLEEFCGECGYDTFSRRAMKTWKAVKIEWKGVERLFSDVLERLQEIA